MVPYHFLHVNVSGGDFILENAVRQYPNVAIFQPVINGVGGNLTAVQASQWSSQRFYSAERAFFSKDRVTLHTIMKSSTISYGTWIEPGIAAEVVSQYENHHRNMLYGWGHF
ncbi:MgtE domain-containing protein [Trichostrongylus colubriformis]|uniref:MgtE domain-containing protein n=1 Tax=Trichostrongylus colubriformis TaxID=6319 RepID=A0AAN8FUH5_TRICO